VSGSGGEKNGGNHLRRGGPGDRGRWPFAEEKEQYGNFRTSAARRRYKKRWESMASECQADPRAHRESLRTQTHVKNNIEVFGGGGRRPVRILAAAVLVGCQSSIRGSRRLDTNASLKTSIKWGENC